MAKKKKNQAEKKKSRADKLRGFATYSNIAFSFAAAGIIGYLFGNFIDNYFEYKKPIWTAIMTALFILAYLLKIVIELIRS
ncbi:MAG: hypothetical protein GVX78_00010 [Bacteroidetes bacterium]|nr:hypothetical protein [Bacteroidota bacterium]